MPRSMPVSCECRAVAVSAPAPSPRPRRNQPFDGQTLLKGNDDIYRSI